LLPEFTYRRPHGPADAVEALAAEGAAALGGGTDLLVLMKEGLAAPSALVDVARLPGARGLGWLADGGVRIGGATTVADLERDARLRTDFPALAQACAAVGTPALRNMGTIAGNLLQRPRCWYFRRGIPCRKSGGDDCPAVHGENQYHAILGGGPCWAVHPSDPAVALVALEAELELVSSAGTRRVPASEFFVLPSVRLDRETILADGELLAAIELPARAAGGIQRYDKLMQRGAWDFALVSLAAHKRRDGEVRLVLGGVAPVPWRVTDSIEEDVASGSLDLDDVATLAERALYDAEPLAGNGYKVELAAALLRRAMSALAGLGG
jgi:xanthine dehydrogenase YagS FAD-binding subunit